MTDFVALDDLRLKTRQRADQVNSQFVSDDELDGYINNSYSELYDIIVSRYDDDYFLKSYSLTVNSGTASYDLPSDFYKARGVDLIISTNESTPLQRYVFADRTRDSLARYARDVKSVSYTHPPSPRDRQKSRMPCVRLALCYAT